MKGEFTKLHIYIKMTHYLKSILLHRIVQGDASEAGILKCMEDQYGDVLTYRAQYPKICEIPFNSTNKFQVSIHEMNDSKDQRFMLVMKVIHEILSREFT